MDLDLNFIWFVLLGVLIAGYFVLDGFDLGVGILHPLASSEQERRTNVNAIGPLWDGNEVWLITFGGALMAAFPEAYATVLSGFYDAIMLLLFALIFRAFSLEFRSKLTVRGWRPFCDWAFFGSSLVIPLVFGIAAGNIMTGLPLDRRGDYVGGVLELFNGYALLVGFMTVSMCAMHGAIFLYLKTGGNLQARMQRWMWHTFGMFLVLYLLTTIYTLMHVPAATEQFEHNPGAWIVVILSVMAIASIPRHLYYGKAHRAFVSSALTIIGFVILFSMALYPNMVASDPNPENSLTIYTAASSPMTLTIMLIIAGIGMPFVLGYTVVIYWTFRGKVDESTHY